MQEAIRRGPRAGRPGEAAAFRKLLQEADFTEAGVHARLEIPSLDDFVSLRKGRETACTIGDALDVLIRLFLDGDPVDEDAFEKWLPADARQWMRSLGLAASLQGGRWFATVALYPVGPLFIASDRSSMPDGSAFQMPADCVYPASGETRFFLESLAPLPCARLLDLGAGTGVAALLAASTYATHAWAADITPRAAMFAEFNRALNGIERATAVCGDLYEPVAGMTFDRIVAHPPYVPVGEATYIYRDGGEDGEQVMRRIVEGLPCYLAPGGRFYGYGMGSDREGEFFEQRIRRWLGDAEAEFDVLLVARTTVTPDAITSPRSEAERRHWTRVFEACRVKYMFHGAILIERHCAPRPSYTVRAQRGPHSGWRETEWLRRWMAACSVDDGPRLALSSRLRISERLELRTLHRVRQGRLAADECVLTTAYPFQAECVCQPWIGQVVAGCNGESTGRDLLAEAVRHGIVRPQYSEEDFARVLCGMISGGFLEIPEFPLPGPAEAPQSMVIPSAAC